MPPQKIFFNLCVLIFVHAHSGKTLQSHLLLDFLFALVPASAPRLKERK